MLTNNDQNQLTSAGSSVRTHDHNGNTPLDDQEHVLVYDAWNRPVCVMDLAGNVLRTYT